jgi:hypothetical protein
MFPLEVWLLAIQHVDFGCAVLLELWFRSVMYPVIDLLSCVSRPRVLRVFARRGAVPILSRLWWPRRRRFVDYAL